MGKNLEENSFDGAPGGDNGTSNYSTGYGTPSGGGVTQNPDHFASSTNNKAGNQNSASFNAASPMDKADKLQSEVPLNPKANYDPQVNQLFTKKNTPSPDEIMSAMQYEMNQMVKKDKTLAKQMVLKNLKQDPQFYSRLNMLNIDDDKMKVDENKTTFDKTKNLLDEMIAQRKNKVVPQDGELDNIFKDMWNRRNSYRNKE